MAVDQITLDLSLAPRWSAEGDDDILIRSAKLVPILELGEEPISVEEAVRRARANPITNRGKRFAQRLAGAMNVILPPIEGWGMGQYVAFAEGPGEPDLGDRYLRVVIHREDGFHVECKSFTNDVGSHGNLLCLNEPACR